MIETENNWYRRALELESRVRILDHLNEGLQDKLEGQIGLRRVAEQELSAAEAEVKRLRDALRAVEWIQVEHGEQKFCPACRRWNGYGHESECTTSAALGAQQAPAAKGEK